MATVDLSTKEKSNIVYLTDGTLNTSGTNGSSTNITYTATNNLFSNTGTRYVAIKSHKFETDDLNKLIILPIPLASGDQETDEPVTWIVDTKEIKEVITVDGHLVNESVDTSLNKKKNLAILKGTGSITDNDTAILRSGNITLIWGYGANQIQRSGTILKCKVTEFPATIGKTETGTTAPHKGYMVSIQFVVGEELSA